MINQGGSNKAYHLYYGSTRIYRAYVGEDLVFSSYLRVNPTTINIGSEVGNSGTTEVESNTEWTIS